MLITYLSFIKIKFLEDMVNSISVENKNPYIVGVMNLKMDSLKSGKIIIQTKIIGIVKYYFLLLKDKHEWHQRQSNLYC